MIDDLEPRFPFRKIHPANLGEIVELKLRMVTQKEADLGDVLSLDQDGLLASEITDHQNGVGEFIF